MMKGRRSESAVGVDDVSKSGAGSMVEEMLNHQIVKYKTESPPLRYPFEKRSLPDIDTDIMRICCSGSKCSVQCNASYRLHENRYQP